MPTCKTFRRRPSVNCVPDGRGRDRSWSRRTLPGNRSVVRHVLNRFPSAVQHRVAAKITTNDKIIRFRIAVRRPFSFSGRTTQPHVRRSDGKSFVYRHVPRNGVGQLFVFFDGLNGARAPPGRPTFGRSIRIDDRTGNRFRAVVSETIRRFYLIITRPVRVHMARSSRGLYRISRRTFRFYRPYLRQTNGLVNDGNPPAIVIQSSRLTAKGLSVIRNTGRAHVKLEPVDLADIIHFIRVGRNTYVRIHKRSETV